MDTVALLTPVDEGSNVTWKVVLPPAVTGEEGCAVTLKSAAWVPLRATFGSPVRLKSEEPVFLMVKVRVTLPESMSALPKSVWSAVEGDSSPSAMEVPLPWTSISVGGGVDIAMFLDWILEFFSPSLT